MQHFLLDQKTVKLCMLIHKVLKHCGKGIVFVQSVSPNSFTRNFSNYKKFLNTIHLPYSLCYILTIIHKRLVSICLQTFKSTFFLFLEFLTMSKLLMSVYFLSMFHLLMNRKFDKGVCSVYTLELGNHFKMLMGNPTYQ